MSDILSGGAIDETTSGPIPISQDNRSLDIIAEVAAKQEREAIGGSQNPPTVEPLPPVRQPPEVAPPPLPEIDIPQLGIDFGGPVYEKAAEAARQAAVDVLKKVTIDGMGPVIEGSSISFNTSRSPSASESFRAAEGSDPFQPRYGSLSDYPVFEAQNIAIQGIKNEAVENKVDISFTKAAENREQARKSGSISFEDASRNREEARNESRTETSGQPKVAQRERDGDISELPSGMIPVRFTRADGQKKILALMATELVGVVEGATGTERTVPLPATNSFYEGGGGGATPPHPWKISIENVGITTPIWKYKIEPASRLYSSFGGSSITVAGADGLLKDLVEGFYFIEVEFDDGEPASASIKTGTNIGSLVETSGEPPVQTKSRQPIGYVWFDESGNPNVRQDAFHNFSFFAVCKNGNPVKVTIAT
jgi:hypothetical protein